jgi:hypothetical protein
MSGGDSKASRGMRKLDSGKGEDLRSGLIGGCWLGKYILCDYSESVFGFLWLSPSWKWE